jgi:predicted Zn-dependent peptidase
MEINFKTFSLKNGMKIIYLPKTDSNISCLSTFIKVGSVNETGNLRGASHFLEHILFKGTKLRPESSQISKELDSVGAYFNAYTDKDLTSFIVKLNSDYLEKGITIVSDMLLNSIFEEKNFELEKRVVVEEINKNLDNPEQQTIENLYKILFKDHPLEYSIGSEEKYILNYNRDEIIDYFKNYYSSNNIVLAISSNLDIQKIKSILNNSFFIDYTPKNIDFTLPLLKPQQIPRFIIKNKELEQVHLAIGFPIESRYSENRYTLDIIKVLLAGNMSSRLFIDLRETHGLSYNISINIDYYENCGCFYIQTSFDKDSLFIKNFSKIKDKDHLKNVLSNSDNLLEFGPGGLPIILENIRKLKKKLISVEELDKVKGFLQGNLVLSTEDSHTLTDHFGKQILHQFNPVEGLNYLIKRYNKIMPRDILEISNKYFDYSKLNISVLGDYNEKDIQFFIKDYCKNYL